MELSKEYLKYSKEEYSYDTIEQECFIDGATDYANSVERLLKEKHDTWADVRKGTDNAKVWDLSNAKINMIEDILHELKNIKP